MGRLRKVREGQEVTIAVLDRSFGDQTEAERLPFAYTSYEPNNDVVVVGVGGRSSSSPVVLRHTVPHPSEVVIHLGAGAFRVGEQGACRKPASTPSARPRPAAGDGLQSEYSLSWREPEEVILPALEELGPGVDLIKTVAEHKRDARLTRDGRRARHLWL